MHAILTFHSIDDQGSILSYPPRQFALLLETLASKNIPVLDLDTLLAPDTARGVAITFDDGMRSVLQNALPVLKDHGAPAHLFLTTGAMGNATPWPPDSIDGHHFTMLDWDDIGLLHAGGVRIECHTRSHPDMRTLSVQQMEEECRLADEEIGSRLGRQPVYLAYPYGYHDSTVRDFARSHYRASVTTELRPLGKALDPAAIPRLDSYYLQSDSLIRGIDSLQLRSYLAARNMLRNLRGSQCRSDAG